MEEHNQLITNVWKLLQNKINKIKKTSGEKEKRKLRGGRREEGERRGRKRRRNKTQ